MDKICPYCAQKVAMITKDHIVSRGLFVQPYPDNLLTVKACEACNQEKGKNEDYLRDFLILHIETAGNATARVLKETTLVRAIGDDEHGNTSKVAQALATRGRPAELYTPSGVFAGNTKAVPVEIERWEAVLQAMVKGLSFKEFRTVLPSDYTVRALEMAPQHIEAVWKSFRQRGARGRRLGDVFCYQCLPTEDPRITFWLLLFYESILFEAATYPPDYWNKEVAHALLDYLSATDI